VQVADPGDQTTARQVVTADVAQADVVVLDGVAQFAGDVEPRQGPQSQGVGEEAHLGRAAAARFGGGGARVIEEQLGRGGIWPSTATPA